MDQLIPFIFAIGAAGLIWIIASLLDKKLENKRQKQNSDSSELYED